MAHQVVQVRETARNCKSHWVAFASSLLLLAVHTRSIPADWGNRGGLEKIRRGPCGTGGFRQRGWDGQAEGQQASAQVRFRDAMRSDVASKWRWNARCIQWTLLGYQVICSLACLLLRLDMSLDCGCFCVGTVIQTGFHHAGRLAQPFFTLHSTWPT